jgi:hypothetical protein
MAAPQPLLAVFEDLHWSDAASLAVFGVLARRLRDAPVLLIGTYRDDEELRVWRPCWRSWSSRGSLIGNTGSQSSVRECSGAVG